MIPEPYRLDHVAARLIERLEGSRPSFPDPDRAAAEFRRITEEIVEGACGELMATALDRPDEQAKLLRQEMIATFLPRYTELAVAMTKRERGGYGMGRLAEPIGRVGLTAGALALAWLDLRFGMGAASIPVLTAIATIPFTPDIAAWVTRRRYARELQQSIDDLAKIQAQSHLYAPPERLKAAEAELDQKPRRPQGQREGPQ